MSEPVEELYFNWLCAKVCTRNGPVHRSLLWTLYTKEFVWFLAMDENRAADGLQLRVDFLRETGYENEQDWYESPCSVFEALVALADRAAFQTDDSIRRWFWKFLENLGLDEYRQVNDFNKNEVEDILDTFIWRAYREDGRGGILPLDKPNRDQRRIELWSQFCDYVEDQGIM